MDYFVFRPPITLETFADINEEEESNSCAKLSNSSKLPKNYNWAEFMD